MTPTSDPIALVGYIVFGFIGLLVFLLPFAELERRINEIRLLRRRQHQQSIKELEKVVQQIKPNWSLVEPEPRLEMMSKFLVAHGQTALAKHVDDYAKAYQRPWWKAWSLVPIVIVNASFFGGAMWLASGPGGWAYFWTAVGMSWFLGLVNIASFFSTGCHEIPQWNRFVAQNWLPEINSVGVRQNQLPVLPAPVRQITNR